MERRTLFTAISTASLALVVGCGAAPVPAERVASSESAIRAANEVGAQQTPNAALHLRLAEDQFAQAKQLISKGDNRRAEWVLLRAESDAELAVALAREATTKAEAQQALDRVRALKTQTQIDLALDQKDGEHS